VGWFGFELFRCLLSGFWNLREMKMTHAAELFALAVPVNHSDHALGPATARVTIVEYGDFECPSCQQAYHGVGILLKHFGSNVRLAFRHFPLREVHPHAELAAEAAEAAGAQGAFWRFHNQLFDNQLHLKAQNLRQYAEQAEIDLRRFDAEMTDHIYLQRVQEHIEGGVRSGVRATPTFFVNGALCDVSFGLDRLRAAVDRAVRA